MSEIALYAMTIAQAVQSSGLSRSTLYELIGAGKLDARKVAGRTLILAESLRAFIEGSPKAVIRAPKDAA
jgi:excisionase family DNA binding protein